MNNGRKSEKMGWILGWSGGFIWVLILALVNLVKGDFLYALAGGGLVITAAIMIFAFSPWRFPTYPYWKLMSPIYLLFFLSVGWLVWISGGFVDLRLNFWSLFLLLPLFLPMYLAGRRRWSEGESKRH